MQAHRRKAEPETSVPKEESVKRMVEHNEHEAARCAYPCRRGEAWHAAETATQQTGQRREHCEPGQHCRPAAFSVRVETCRKSALLHNEARPRDGAREDVGAQKGPQGPSFEMGAENVGTKRDAMPNLAQASTKLDVLDAGAAIGFGKATECKERLPPNSAAPRPEGLRLAPTVLVDIVVQQVLIPAHVAHRGRLVVVGSEGGHQVRAIHEEALELGQGVRVYLHVGVHEYQNVPAGLPRTAVAGNGRSPRSFQGEHLGRKLGSPRKRPIRTAIVGDDHLIRFARGLSKRLQA